MISSAVLEILETERSSPTVLKAIKQQTPNLSIYPETNLPCSETKWSSLHFVLKQAHTKSEDAGFTLKLFILFMTPIFF